jgi:hypothetical protein
LKKLILAAGLVLAALTFPTGALADSPICHNGVLSDDAGQGCTNDAAYGGAPASSATSGWSDGAICHDGSLSDDAGQNCADGLYEKVYGSSGSGSSSSGSGICHDGILSDDVGQGCADSPSSSSSSSTVSSAPAVSSSSSYSDIPGVPSSFAACVAERESSNGAGSSNIYGIIADPRGNGSLAEQKQAFSELYAASGTQPWAPYDGC